MTDQEMVEVPRREYDALIARLEDLEDVIASRAADDGSRIPHDVAVAIMKGTHPVAAFRAFHGLTLRDLAQRAGIGASYLSEIERRIKPGSTSALSKLADALETRIDVLIES